MENIINDISPFREFNILEVSKTSVVISPIKRSSMSYLVDNIKFIKDGKKITFKIKGIDCPREISSMLKKVIEEKIKKLND